LYLLIDNIFYDIKQMNLILEFRNIDNRMRTFTVRSGKIVLAELIYERIKTIEDNWSNEDDLDMFAWISIIYSKRRLDFILQY